MKKVYPAIFEKDPVGQTVLMTIVTRYELPLLREAMKSSDPQAFVSIAENVQILGRFYEDGI